MDGLRGLGQVPARWVHLAGENLISRVNPHQSADGIAVAARPTKTEGQVTLPRRTILEVVRAVVEVVHHNLKPSIAVEIGDGRAAGTAGHRLAAHRLGEMPSFRGRLDALFLRALAETSVAIVHPEAIRPV